MGFAHFNWFHIGINKYEEKMAGNQQLNSFFILIQLSCKKALENTVVYLIHKFITSESLV